jgi:hypothetical protein
LERRHAQAPGAAERQPFAELPPSTKPRLPKAAAMALVRKQMQSDLSPGHMRRHNNLIFSFRYLRHPRASAPRQKDAGGM